MLESMRVRFFDSRERWQRERRNQVLMFTAAIQTHNASTLPGWREWPVDVIAMGKGWWGFSFSACAIAPSSPHVLHPLPPEFVDLPPELLVYLIC
jgi:hypothetical protein